jgi:cbb3-type cytochrome oxidase maturation protein
VYFPYFVVYMVLGLAIGLGVFLWALGSGQFRDQQRARFLPLQGGADPPAAPAARLGRLESYTLFLLAALGLLASGAVLIFALLRAG